MKRTLGLEVTILNRMRIGSVFLCMDDSRLVKLGPTLDLQVRLLVRPLSQE